LVNLIFTAVTFVSNGWSTEQQSPTTLTLNGLQWRNQGGDGWGDRHP